MKFTVVIPVFNGEKFVSRSIQSVLNQTYPDVELIIVNDGSTDRSDEIIKKIIDGNPHRQIVYKAIENSGPSTARNVGIDLAQGDYICFLDSDDEYGSNLFSDLSEALHGEEICFFGWIEKNENGGAISFRYEDRFGYPPGTISGTEAARLKYNHDIWLCNCNEVYSLNFLRTNRLRYLEGVYSGEDSNFIYKCLLNAKRVTALQGDYFINYIRKDSLMHSSFSPRCLTDLTACENLYRYAVENNYDPELCDMFFTLYYNSRIYIAKRIVRSLGVMDGFRFCKLCRKYIPKLKKERKLLQTPKEKRENFLFKFKLPFFLIYKYYIRRNLGAL